MTEREESRVRVGNSVPLALKMEGRGCEHRDALDTGKGKKGDPP